MKLHPKLFLSAALAAAMAIFTALSGADARKVSTRLRAPESSKSKISSSLKTYPHHATEFERVSENLTFMAYDKRAGADKETFFVDNGSSSDLSLIEVEISYFNVAGKQIHKRTVELSQTFPAKETRKVDIKTWDTQKSFHYINSTASSKGSTPYTVRFKVISYTPKK